MDVVKTSKAPRALKPETDCADDDGLVSNGDAFAAHSEIVMAECHLF
jgi:hypothetical protein